MITFTFLNNVHALRNEKKKKRKERRKEKRSRKTHHRVRIKYFIELTSRLQDAGC